MQGHEHLLPPTPGDRPVGATVLRLTDDQRQAIIRQAIDELPNEACGLLAARPGSDTVEAVYPCTNAAKSHLIYLIDSRDQLKADRAAEAAGMQIAGAYHSHTHTPAYPSPTDVAQAPDPDWHYLLVSLAETEPVLRSFRIAEGQISEEALVLDGKDVS